jgi:hypothetical protein
MTSQSGLDASVWESLQILIEFPITSHLVLGCQEPVVGREPPQMPLLLTFRISWAGYFKYPQARCPMGTSLQLLSLVLGPLQLPSPTAQYPREKPSRSGGRKWGGLSSVDTPSLVSSNQCQGVKRAVYSKGWSLICLFLTILKRENFKLKLFTRYL